jgi:DNA-directed RNA polymerase specialized sigma24 family protein
VQNGRVLDVAERNESDERFQDTSWSVVIAAGATTPERAHAAMSELCRIYWRPIYAYLRRSGYNTHNAQDFTQSFFQHLLENETLRRVSREKGRFRSFLLGTLKRCLADEQMQRHTLKRGGGMQFISTDELDAEELHHLRADHEAAPDEILDARWAGVVLERALDRVRAECAAEGKTETFEALYPFLAGTKPQVSYQEVADRMKLGLGAVTTLIHRLRRQFGAAVRREIMQTVSAPHEVDDELRRLRSVFARTGQQAF